VARAFDVTVVVPASLRSIFEGRTEVRLGVPATAGVADVLETLLRLYPRLHGQLASDRDGARRHMHLAVGEATSAQLAAGQGGLAAGQRLYLFALSRERPSGRPGLEG